MARTVGWEAGFVGVSYRNGGRDIAHGIDCWGLVYCVFRDILGIELPKWDTVSDFDQAHRIITQERNSPEWIAVNDCREFDIAEMRGIYADRSGRIHCGLILHRPPEIRVLHCERNAGVVSVPLSSLIKRDPHIYRHRSQIT